MDKVRVTGADVGIAHDGDADRMMAVDNLGRFVSGDRMLLLMARALGATRVVTTIDASMSADQAGLNLSRTAVGDNNVCEELKLGGEFGGEPSGAWIFPQSSLCPDGIFAAALMVSMAASSSLADMVDALPEYPCTVAIFPARGLT
jgi:phosphoglucosamine mutase